MAATQWGLFAGVVGLVTLTMLGLARATQRALSGGTSPGGGDPRDPRDPHDPDASARGTAGRAAGTGRIDEMGAGALLANVALTHGLVGGLIAAVAWYARVPPGALGLPRGPATAALGPAVAVGVPLGVGLSLANEGASRVADLAGLEYDERLREALAPSTPAGWVVLLGGALPLVAGVEELLFRAALIGALSTGLGWPAWALAVVSSALFGLGHGLQGPVGAVATGAFGLALAAAFVLTGSLAAVVVAHYLVNALEFLLHEA